MHYDITKKSQQKYRITTPGIHVFTFENKNGHLRFEILHPDARVYILGFYDVHGKDHYTLSTEQVHKAPTAESHTIIKGVFHDTAHFSYDGYIEIAPEGTGTKASLINKNLIVSENARIQTKPALSILPADVTCMHAATVSYIDHDQKNALIARGISQHDAEKLLVDGFVQDFMTVRDNLITKATLDH